MSKLMTLPRRGRVRVRSVHKGAVRKVCRCEPVTDVTGVAAPRLDGNSLVLRPRCLKIRGIATPACALVRNDRAFSNSPIPCFTTTRLWAAAFFDPISYSFFSGSWLINTAAKTSTQPSFSALVMVSWSSSQPKRAAKTDSRLMSRAAALGATRFWPTICRV